MKTVNKTVEKKRKVIKKPKVKNKKEKVLVVAQEIKFARLLSGNEKKTRDKVLKTFKKWLLNCFTKGYEFKEDDFLRVWKGLFYAVWMSDKPLIQEELCETISGILDLFPAEQLKPALLMAKAGFKVLATEWYGIDYHRMDKFLMLARRYLRGSLRAVRRSGWVIDACRAYADMLAGSDGILALKTPHYARNAGSLLLHIVDCFLEELAKVSSGSIPEGSVAELLRPFCAYTCGGEAPALCVAARRLLTALLRQSPRGLEYQQRTRAWERMGCPRGGPDALEPASDDEEPPEEEEEEEIINGTEKPMDPRAGRVNVELECIPVPSKLLADMLRKMLTTASSKAHRRAKICLQRFEQLSKDQYPLVVKDVFEDSAARAPPPRPPVVDTVTETAEDLALRGLSRKHRKRLLAKARSGQSIIEDLAQTTNGNWEVSAEPEKSNKQTDTSNKENVQHTKKRKQIDASADKLRKRQKTKKDGNNGGEKSDVKNYEKTTNSNKKKKAKLLGVDKNVANKNEKTSKLLNGVAEKDSVASKVEKPTPKLLNGISEKVSVASNKDKKSPKLFNGVPEKLKDSANQNDKTKSEKSKKPIQVNKQINSNIPSKLDEKKTVKLSKSEVKDSNKKEVKDAIKTNKIIGKNKPLTNKMESKKASVLVNKVKNYQKKTEKDSKTFDTPKRVKFVLKNNSMQGPVDYYKSVRQSPNIPFDSSKRPSKTNLKPSTPSPINPFFKKKLRLK